MLSVARKVERKRTRKIASRAPNAQPVVEKWRDEDYDPQVVDVRVAAFFLEHEHGDTMVM